MTGWGQEGPQEDPEALDRLEVVLGDLLTARRLCADLVQSKEGLLREVRAAGVPKTGPKGVGARVRARLAARGWTPEDVEAVGVSDMTVRQAIERA